MKRLLFTLMAFAAASMFTACGEPGAANTASKPANAASNANSAAAPVADKAAVEAEVRKMMDEFNAALNKGDAATLEKMYSDEYMLVDQNGAVQTKASRIEAIKSGKLKWEGLKFGDLKIKTHPSGDGAIVTGLVTGKMTVDGKGEDRNSMVTWVLGKSKDKGWQFMNAQITDIKGGAKVDDKAKADDKAKTEDKLKTDAKASDKAPAANK